MDRLDELALLIAIVEEGSLAAGARRMRRSAAAATRVLNALEHRTGVRLLDRNTRRSSPTQAGRDLAARARQLIAAYDEAMEEVVSDAAQLRGALRISAPLVFGRRYAAPLVASFLAAHPNTSAELVLSDVLADLIAEDIDVAVRIGALTASGLVARRVAQVRRVVVASRAYLARRGEPRRVSDLAAHECILQERHGSRIEWPFRTGRGRVTSIRPQARFVVNSADAVIDAACASYGLAMPLSYQAADRIASGELVVVLKAFAPAPLPVNVVFTSKQVPLRVRALIDHLVNGLEAIDQSGWT